MSLLSVCRRIVAVTAGAAALAVGLALPALAHVTVNPRTAEKGGFTKLAFRVPNERDDASTTKVEVRFPTDHPLPFVSVRPVPGWKVEVTRGELPKPVVSESGDTITESVLKITWTGGKIEPGQFQEFEVSVGRLPTTVDRLIFPAVQTYSSGEVVEWTEEPKDDGSEPEHPAPVLTLVDPAGTASAAPAAPSTAPAVAAEPVGTGGSGGSDGTARTLGVLGIIAGLLGVGVGVAGLRRARG